MAPLHGQNDATKRVREISRLISRLRHRQFGILITTSYVDRQAYREIKEDGHPIIVVSAVDIIGIMKKSGIGTVNELQTWAAGFVSPDRGHATSHRPTVGHGSTVTT